MYAATKLTILAGFLQLTPIALSMYYAEKDIGLSQFEIGAFLALILPLIVIILPWMELNMNKNCLCIMFKRFASWFIRHEINFFGISMVLLLVLEILGYCKLITWLPPTFMAARDVFWTGFMFFSANYKIKDFPILNKFVWRVIACVFAFDQWCFDYIIHKPNTISPLDSTNHTLPAILVFILMTCAGIYTFARMHFAYPFPQYWLLLLVFTFMTGAHIASAAFWYFYLITLSTPVPKFQFIPPLKIDN